MKITILDKHTGLREDYEELRELQTGFKNIYMVIQPKGCWIKSYYFDKNDYEIAYIG